MPSAPLLYGPKLLSEELPMATRRYNIPLNQEVSKRYASDLNDQEFALLAPHVAQKDGGQEANGRHPRSAERDLLSHQNRLSMADAAERFSGLVSRLVLLSKVAP